MLNSLLLNPDVQLFLRQNLSKDIRTLSLQKSPFNEIKSSELAEQIKGLQISKTKFPFLFNTENIYYPPSLNLEQASSQATAEYKSTLIQGESLLDLTAGLGIDSYSFSKNFEEVTALERNEDLVDICQHNYKVLNSNNLKYINSTFENYLKENSTKKWEVIYVDPARRKNSQKKFLLEDLEPNLLEWMEEFFKHSDWVMVKLSPLIDITKVIEQIPQTQEIHLVAVKNEVKELILLCRNQRNTNPKIVAVNLETQQNTFSFYFDQEKNAENEFSFVENYLYEPNAAVLKSGGFKLLAQRFDLKKLEINTHLYTSKELNLDFPGKIFEVLEEIKNVKNSIRNQSFHVISKNYPLSVENIRKKYKISQSEDQTLVFTKSMYGLLHLKCKRIH